MLNILFKNEILFCLVEFMGGDFLVEYVISCLVGNFLDLGRWNKLFLVFSFVYFGRI